MFTDTDSLWIETEEDFYGMMYEFKELFDFCNDYKKVPGKMKDEYGGKIICEFIGLKSKMYSLLDVNSYEKSIHKGHNSNISNSEFKDILFNKKVIRHKMSGIKSINHI